MPDKVGRLLPLPWRLPLYTVKTQSARGDQTNVIRGGPIFWAVILLLIYLAAKEPGTLSALFNAIGHALAVFARGVAAFLNSVLTTSS